MSKRMFTKKQIKSLLANDNIIKCSNKAITYNPEFKLRAVIRYYNEGLSSKQIFVDEGFDMEIIGKDTPKDCIRKWKKIYKIKGAAGLLVEGRGRHKKGGRPKTRDLTDKEKIERLEATVAYLKAENDFLAKLRAARKE